MHVNLSIVVPAYNEEKKMRNTFARIDRFFSPRKYHLEFIFVEDGSRDGTRDVLSEIAAKDKRVRVIVNESNMGKGRSIKRGILAAQGDFILFMDADMATPLKAFNDFEKYLNDYDIVMGSRWREESNIRIPQPWYRRMMGKVFYVIVHALFLKGVTDTNCGFKCYRRGVAKDIFERQRLKGWGFDVELLYIAQKRGYRIKEVPVVWAHGRDSKVSLVKVPFLTLCELYKIKRNDILGRYEK